MPIIFIILYGLYYYNISRKQKSYGQIAIVFLIIYFFMSIAISPIITAGIRILYANSWGLRVSAAISYLGSAASFLTGLFAAIATALLYISMGMVIGYERAVRESEHTGNDYSEEASLITSDLTSQEPAQE